MGVSWLHLSQDRAGAKNVVDVRWVYKSKFDAEVRSADTSDAAASMQRRVIRARLCLRGFKDQQSQGLANYAGTSQRYSQRIVCSEAVLRQWPLVPLIPSRQS